MVVMRAVVVGVMLAATMLPGLASAQDEPLTEEEYLAKIGVLTEMMGEAMSEFGEKAERFADDPSDREALAEVAAETGVFEAAYAAALALDPPPSMMAVHLELLEALEPYAEAAPLARGGMAEIDPDAIREATALIDEGNAQTGDIRAALEAAR